MAATVTEGFQIVDMVSLEVTAFYPQPKSRL
jgi:hypothetical protein